MIPSDNDTWGISGPAFLLAYVVIAVAVGVTAIRTRRRLADGSSQRRVTRLDGRPYDVAYVNGGADLALCAALSAMYRAGTISTSGRGGMDDDFDSEYSRPSLLFLSQSPRTSCRAAPVSVHWQRLFFSGRPWLGGGL